jgi:hypothetical protein
MLQNVTKTVNIDNIALATWQEWLAGWLDWARALDVIDCPGKDYPFDIPTYCASVDGSNRRLAGVDSAPFYLAVNSV